MIQIRKSETADTRTCDYANVTKVTTQDPLVQTHVHLNRLRAIKAVKRVKAA